MTARLVFEGMLTELSKTGAPSLLLQDFNYFFNKAINLYINKRYNIYDINQLTTDDLRVLKATTILNAKKATEGGPLKLLSELGAGNSKLLGATYEVELPNDYLHILNCVCIYKMSLDFKCYDKGNFVPFSAKRLTADSFSVILNDYYTRPLPERPYYYIHNINNNIEGDIPEEIDTEEKCIKTPFAKSHLTPTNSDTDVTVDYKVDPESIGAAKATAEVKTSDSNFSRTIDLGTLWKGEGETANTVLRKTALRYGNSSKVRMEIRYGNDDTVFKLEKVLVDYIKTPQHIRLTLELMNLTEDTSQIMEFPDYVCQEIINELTMLVMENQADPRLLTNTTVTQSIANPAQQLTPQPQSRRRKNSDD